MGGPVKKQFIQFHGKELWRYIYDTACEVLPKNRIVVVGVDIPGGSTRSESVKNGLEWIARYRNCNRVVICEAARALVTSKQLQEIIDYKSSAKNCRYNYPYG